MLMFMMSTGSRTFKESEEIHNSFEYLNELNLYSTPHGDFYPLYEAKLFHQYDHRYATFEGKETRYTTVEEKSDWEYVISPRYWISKEEVDNRLGQVALPEESSTWERNWLIQFRNISLPTNERTAIFSIVPKTGVGNSSGTLISSNKNAYILVSMFNSFIFDYCVRQKIGGMNITFGYIQQFPVVPPIAFTASLIALITPRMLELTYTAFDLTGFARDLKYPGDPFTWNDERRFWLRAELDALYFILYGIDRDDVDYIMDTFPIVKRKDIATHGTYRTKDAILAIYDELQTLGLERFREYQSRVLTLGLNGGDVAGGWRPE